MPIVLIGSFLFYSNYRSLHQHYKNMIISDNLRIKSVMFEVTTAVTNLCDSISDDQRLHTLIATNYDDLHGARKALEEFRMLRDYYERHTEVSSIILYTDNQTLFSYEHIKVITLDEQEWFANVTSVPGYYWSTESSTNRYDITDQELRLLHPIAVNNSDEIAILVITISNNYLKNRISNNDLEVDLTVNHDPVFYSSWGNKNRVIDFDEYYEQDYYYYSGNTEYMGIKTMLEVSTIRPIRTDDSIYVFSNNPQALSDINRIIFVNVLIVVMSIVFPLFIIFKYTRQLTNRVNTLKTEMHRVTMGDYEIIEQFKGNDELADLFKDLQNMIQSIKLKNQAIYESEIKEQKLISHAQQMELDLLGSKINPHFLYNTLETIRMKAVASQDLEVADAIKMLGKYMRYNLEQNGQVTTLESEISYIIIFLNIQNLRFYNRIKHSIYVDKGLNLHEITTLPLLIQPIVENAFSHALIETTENGELRVSILDKGDNVLIEVEDNGKGIPEVELMNLREKLKSQNNKEYENIGLYNIHNRLRLYYGDEYGLTITSEVGKGTTVQFTIPK